VAIWPRAATSCSGRKGYGVGILTGSCSSSPFFDRTDALRPVPPMSNDRVLGKVVPRRPAGLAAAGALSGAPTWELALLRVCALCLAAAGVLFLARALVGAAAFPVALALALRAALALARARGSAAGLVFALGFGFRPGRAGGVGMAVTVVVFHLHFSIDVRPAPGP
jgi:hypothetical protein